MILAQLKARRGLRDVVANIGWMASDRIIRMGGGVMVGVAVARYLGPDEFGLLNYALALYAIFNILSNLGLDQILVRDVVFFPDQESELLGTAFFLKASAGMLTTLLAVASTFVLRPGDAEARIIVALVSIAAVTQACDVIEFFFQAKTRSKYSVAAKNIAFVLASVARLWAVLAKAPLLTFAWIAAAEIAVGEMGLFAAYRVYGRSLRAWRISLPAARRLLVEGWPLMLSGLLVMIYMRTDQVLLGSLAGPHAVGEYTAALRLSEIWYAIPILVAASVMPKLLTLKTDQPRLYYSRLQRFYDCMVGISVLLAVLVSLFGRFGIALLYGHQYSEAYAVLAIHIWTAIFVFVGVVSGQQIVHEGLQHLQLKRSAAGATLNVVLNFVLVPRYAAAGAAIATLVSYCIAAYLVDYAYAPLRPMFWMKTRAFVGYSFWGRPAFPGIE